MNLASHKEQKQKMASIKDFTEKQMKIFEKKLSVKTGWGRNEVKVQLLEATNEALAELLSETPSTGISNFTSGLGEKEAIFLAKSQKTGE